MKRRFMMGLLKNRTISVDETVREVTHWIVDVKHGTVVHAINVLVHEYLDSAEKSRLPALVEWENGLLV